MTINFYADFGKLAELKGSAQNDNARALHEAARQFESLFTQMMLKSMRDASQSLSAGESLMDNDQSNMYQEMFDNQLSMQLSKGRGMGLADMLVRQLAGSVAGAKAAAQPTEAVAEPAVKSFPIKRNSDGTERVFKDLPSTSVVPASPAAPISVPAKMTVEKTTAVIGPLRAPLAQSREQFVAQMLPHAEAAAKELGVDVKTLIAHAALETGWGKFVPCNPDGSCSFNLFGIKATGKVSDSWNGAATAVNTLEYEGGVAVKRRDSFRAYESPADSFRDYAALLKNSKRYASAIGAGDNAHAFASALQNGGYATDPNYADKLTSVATALKNFLAAPLASGSGVARGGSRS